jgi:hypothetical protein
MTLPVRTVIPTPAGVLGLDAFLKHVPGDRLLPLVSIRGQPNPFLRTR